MANFKFSDEQIEIAREWLKTNLAAARGNLALARKIGFSRYGVAVRERSGGLAGLREKAGVRVVWRPAAIRHVDASFERSAAGG